MLLSHYRVPTRWPRSCQKVFGSTLTDVPVSVSLGVGPAGSTDKMHGKQEPAHPLAQRVFPQLTDCSVDDSNTVRGS